MLYGSCFHFIEKGTGRFPCTCWIWLELPNGYQTIIHPMRRLPRDVRAFGSMRLCLREAWRRNELKKRRTAETAVALAAVMAAVGHRCQLFGSATAAVSFQFVPLRWPLWSWQQYRQRSWWILVTWHMDHGFLSGQVQHGLGSGWPTATWIVVNHKHALNQEIFMEEEIGCFWKF